MAEAHSAVAFSFTVTPDGVQAQVNHEAIKAVFYSGVHSWKKRIAQFKNRCHNHVYPAHPASWVFTVVILLALAMAGFDPYSMISTLQHWMPVFFEFEEQVNFVISVLVVATIAWVLSINIIKYILKMLLEYMSWMYEPRGKMSLRTKIWMGLVKVFSGRNPLLYSFQGSLPKMPVPPVAATIERYLKSVRPLNEDDNYNRLQKLAEEFRDGIANKLQRYLILKSWWATNYVSDWWEEYVYLRGRSPIMVNSNFYGVDAVLVHPTSIQAARAANGVYSMLQFRRSIDREELMPIMLSKTIPLCSSQYERLFNTTRVPGVETDRLVHFGDSKHIAVYHKGRYFKMYIHYKGRLLTAQEIEIMLQKILDDESEPVEGEEHLAALTAGDRVPWAKARLQYFAKGVNKSSLDAIEKAAFCLTLEDEAQDYDPNDHTALDRFGSALLHGKGYDRWFDKSFSLVVFSNGRIGFNAEHSWADAPIMAQLWEVTAATESHPRGSPKGNPYGEDGHCIGEVKIQPPNPIRLQWEISEQCCNIIENSLQVANNLLEDVDLHVLMHNAFGKGLMKRCKMSPDAYIQMGLQLAYFRDAGKFCLTYEASMTRLYREGRTETVRSCTVDSCNFVRAMCDKSKTKEEKKALLSKATDSHQQGYRDAMTGKGIDRHLFCLYVVSKYLGVDSPFLKEVLSEPWRLSTSQTPHQQTDKLDLVKYPQHISGGGGFGPVADDGYGVSYVVAGEDNIFFHISCKKSFSGTNSFKFGKRITQSLSDIKDLFDL